MAATEVQPNKGQFRKGRAMTGGRSKGTPNNATVPGRTLQQAW